jgi:ABC-type nitrate/sulfonate/bicarbonate transport system ATPase subunit
LHPVVAGEVGVVPQNYILFNHRTVLENLKIGLRSSNNKSSEKEKTNLIEEYANKFGLKEHLKKYPMQLSGGQRQRVSIIQQILTGNKFILLDEPFSGLDPVIKDVVIDLLVSISTLDELNTLVIVSHDIESAFAISDTAFVLANQEHKEGSTIVETIDLIEMGFCWNPEIKKNKDFQDLVTQMKFRM